MFFQSQQRSAETGMVRSSGRVAKGKNADTRCRNFSMFAAVAVRFSLSVHGLLVPSESSSERLPGSLNVSCIRKARRSGFGLLVDLGCSSGAFTERTMSKTLPSHTYRSK